MATASSNPFTIQVIDPPTGVPSWYSNAASGQWVAVPNSTFSASPAYTQAGLGGARPVVEAWCGGVLNTVGVHHGGSFVPGIFLILWGGGHGDYSGNEVYAFGPLNSESPIWRMLTNPTLPAPSNQGRDANGKPVSRHTYDSLGYLAATNRMISVGTPPAHINGNSYNTADMFSFGVNPATTNPWTPIGTTVIDPSYGAQMMQCAVDEIAGKVYGLCRNGSLNIYDIASNTWSVKNEYFGWDWYNCTADIDPTSKVIIQVDGESAVGGPAVHGLDVRNPGGTIPSFTVSASGQPTGAPVSTVFDARTGKWVSWIGGKTLYYLTPPASPYSGTGWSWTNTTPVGGATPPAGISQGTYKRFGAMPVSMPGYYLMPRWDTPVYIYKP